MKIATFYDHILELASQENISVMDAMKEAKELGITAVEVSSNNIIEREDELKKELRETGIVVSSVCAYFDFGNSKDEKIIDDMLDMAVRVGAEEMLAIPGFFDEDDSEEAQKVKVNSITDMMNILSEKASEKGITLLLEDYDSDLSPYATIEGVKHFVDNVKGLKVSFDTGNFMYSGDDELDAYKIFRNDIAHVHFKDRALKGTENGKPDTTGRVLYPSPVGSGVVKIREIIESLKNDEFDGYCAIEHYGSPNQREYLKKSVEYLKESI